MNLLVLATLAYLIGSIPSAYLAGKLRGIDIRKAGSGNSGASNAFRVLGPAAAIGVLALDAGKGVFSVLVLAPLLTGGATDLVRVLLGAFCILGHIFPIWLDFKGGKGVATGAAVVAVLSPWTALVCLLVFLAILTVTRYVSLSSMSAAFVLPAAYFVMHGGPVFADPVFIFCAASAVLVIVAHRKNMGRLRRGEEPKIGRSAK